MGAFDEMARHTVKIDGGGFFPWALRQAAEPVALAFVRWDDARRVSPPGWPERTDDVVAVLRDARGAEAWVIVESETDPERFVFHRLGVYGLLLGMELGRAAPAGEVPAVGVVLLNLTGEVRAAEYRSFVAGTSYGLIVKPIVVNLRTLSAAATLGDIEAGRTARCVLPWVPLMQGGGQPGVIARWKAIAEGEVDLERRVLYRDIALVFAELVKDQVNWYQALEGWLMLESKIVQGWLDRGIQRGTVKALREAVLDLVAVRLVDPPPEKIRLAVEGTHDEATLKRWHRLSATVTTVDELVAAMTQEPNGA